ncbi:MAG: hypothetical protein L0Y58_12315 [Verrucomicrobia subdivision 3 bacterium]|nr:hypothetical protein [Limisphaerales bacterium]
MDKESSNNLPAAKGGKTGGGRAFHSRLESFVDFIREQRQRRRTWKEIAEALHAEKGCVITFQGVHQFYRRYLKLSARPHWERAPVPSPITPPPVEPFRNTPQASVPFERPFRQPPPDSIQLNDPNNV